MTVEIVEIAQTSKKMKIVTEYHKPNDQRPDLTYCSVLEEAP
jgi:hypothetical protein